MSRISRVEKRVSVLIAIRSPADTSLSVFLNHLKDSGFVPLVTAQNRCPDGLPTSSPSGQENGTTIGFSEATEDTKKTKRKTAKDFISLETQAASSRSSRKQLPIKPYQNKPLIMTLESFDRQPLDLKKKPVENVLPLTDTRTMISSSPTMLDAMHL